MAKVTVVLCTKRKEPQFEWALESLKSQTFTDFEYIIIDSFYDKRNDVVARIIRDHDLSFPIRYIKDKPSRWKNKRPALCNARNTALMFADSKYIVFHDDNCKMPQDWLGRHLNWLEQGYLVAGSWIPYENGSIIYDRQDTRLETVDKPKAVSGGWLYGTNFSFPLCAAEDINGFDELYDGEIGQDDIDFGVRAERKGYKIMYDPTCYVEHYYDDHGLLMNYQTKHHSKIEIDVAPVTVVIKGIEYLSNQLLVQELIDDECRYLPRGNNFNIPDIRRIAKRSSISNVYSIMTKYISLDKLDWRDGKLIECKIKN